MNSLPSRWRGPLLLGAAGMAAAFLYVQARKAQVERQHPPAGKFVEVDGVRLHYLEQGQGPTVVLLHGNGVTADDFALSGVLDALSERYHVIAFDRPGFGYSERPGGTSWTPEVQARLFYQALHQLRVERPIVLGHSWGTLVALAMALEFPRYVRGITLVGGYYYPGPRLDAVLGGLPALPVLGQLWRYTLAPLLGRLMWPRLAQHMFAPAPVPRRFAALDGAAARPAGRERPGSSVHGARRRPPGQALPRADPAGEPDCGRRRPHHRSRPAQPPAAPRTGPQRSAHGTRHRPHGPLRPYRRDYGGGGPGVGRSGGQHRAAHRGRGVRGPDPALVFPFVPAIRGARRLPLAAPPRSPS